MFAEPPVRHKHLSQYMVNLYCMPVLPARGRACLTDDLPDETYIERSSFDAPRHHRKSTLTVHGLAASQSNRAGKENRRTLQCPYRTCWLQTIGSASGSAKVQHYEIGASAISPVNQ